MTILNDKQIEDLCDEQKMITPYAIKQVREVDGKRVISYGLSSFGYDARVADEFMLPRGSNLVRCIDPKGGGSYAEFMTDPARNDDGSFFVPPNTMALARTVEYFRIPDDVMVICLGKSTYARCGLIVNVTPLEPGWCGHVTLELSNTTPLPIKVYPNEGIAQFVFFRGERPAVTYGDRAGKYQGQTGITVAKL